jgi:hypothetical protein
MQKMNTMINIWIMLTKDQRHIAMFPSSTPCFYSKYLMILLMSEFSSKFYSNYFSGGCLNGLLRLILEMKFRARILTLCFVTIVFSLKGSFFLSYLIRFRSWFFPDCRLRLLVWKLWVKSLLDSDKKLPGMTLKSSSY